MTAAAAFWNRVARRYAAMPVGNPEAYEATLVRVAAHLSPGDRVVEIGCGTGSTALRLAPAVADYLASDASPEMIAIGREKADGGPESLRFLEAALGDPALAGAAPPGGFDAVLAFSLLHLLDDLDAGLGEIRGMLRPGGLLIAKTVCLGERRLLFRPLVSLLQALGKAPPGLRFLTVDGLEQAVARAGFEIVERGDHPSRWRGRFLVARRF